MRVAGKTWGRTSRPHVLLRIWFAATPHMAATVDPVTTVVAVVWEFCPEGSVTVLL